MTNYHCIPVPRGCGTRLAGDLYACCGIAPHGTVGAKRIEDFLIDPPQPVPLWMNLAPLGTRLFARQDKAGNYVTHVADWVGSQHYPNVADLVEEVRRFGLSRKLAKTLLAQKTIMTWDAKARQVVTIPTPPLTAASRIFLAHSRGYLDNGGEYVAGPSFMTGPSITASSSAPCCCPKGLADHDAHPLDPDWDAADFMCAGLWWQDIAPFKGVAPAPGADPRLVTRTMPSFSYEARTPPPGVTPAYSAQPAFFAAFPITTIEVIAGMPSSQATAKTLTTQTGLPVRVVPI